MNKFKNTVHTKITTKTCLKCLKTIEGILTCSRCRTAKYCSKQCQEKHWKVHKLQCTDSNKHSDNFKGLLDAGADPTKVNHGAEIAKKMCKLQNFLDQVISFSTLS